MREEVLVDSQVMAKFLQSEIELRTEAKMTEPKWQYALVDILTGKVLYQGPRAMRVVNWLQPGTTFKRNEDVNIAVFNAKEHARRWLDIKRRHGI